MKKILYIITKAEPFGGASKYVLDMATHLKDEFNVVVALGGEGTLKERLLEVGVRTIPIHAFQRDINIKKEISSFFEILRIYRSEKPDIIHLNSSKAGGTGAFVGRIYNKFFAGDRKAKIVFTGHGWEHTARRPRWQKKLIYLLHLLTIAFTHTTIAVSHFSKKEIIDPLKWPFRNNIEKKMVVIHNGLEHFDTLPMRLARKALLELTPFKGVVDLWSTNTLWIGSIAELRNATKGIDVAIRAIAELVEHFRKYEVSLVYFIIGEGEDRIELEALIRKHKLESYVFLVGRIPDAKIYLSAFEVFLMTSRKEGFPYVVLEASYAGLPLVATRVGGVPEAMRENASGYLVESENSETLSKALLDLAQDAEKRIDFGKTAEDFVRGHFSLELQIEKTKDVYKIIK